MLVHEAEHEAHVAAEAAAKQKSYFDERRIPSVARRRRLRGGSRR
jgi:dihydrolipoamide dehydrogenase